MCSPGLVNLGMTDRTHECGSAVVIMQGGREIQEWVAILLVDLP